MGIDGCGPTLDAIVLIHSVAIIPNAGNVLAGF